jgi:hypothetical protein
MGTGVPSWNETDDPLKVVQMVSGSLPIFSLVVPLAAVDAEPGKVTGIGTLQVLLFEPTVTPTIELASSERVYDKLGRHWSRNMRFLNSVLRSLSEKVQQ